MIKIKVNLKPRKKDDAFWDTKTIKRATATQAAIKAKARPRQRIVRVKIKETTIAKKTLVAKK